MTPSVRKTLFMALLGLTLLWPAVVPGTAVEEEAFNPSRAKLLSYMLRQQLSRHHYSHKEVDDALSGAAFDLYLKQFDSQKRFLLQGDVDRLGAFSQLIDDEIISGKTTLPATAARIFETRVKMAERIVASLFEQEIDLASEEFLETDPDKLVYCKDEAQLTERWRKILKLQINNRYLNLLEDEGLEPGAITTEEQKQLAAEQLVKAREKVKKSNEDFLGRVSRETLQDHVDRYFNAVARAFDPHTNYMPPTEKEDFDIHMRGSLEGIGATLREEDGYVKVVAIIPGSAAARQGILQPEDIILKVAQGDEEPVEITDTRLRDAVTLIRGPKGTEVRLTVKRPDGSRLVIPIIRDVVQIEETFVKATTLTDEVTGKSYGYIKVPGFYRDFRGRHNGGNGRNVTDDLSAAVEDLKKQKVAGIILDLRNNGGGALSDAVSVTGLFIEEGPVVQVRDSDGDMKILDDDDRSVAYDGPLVVLVNRFSASASEIVAGALQDYDRAVVLGGGHTHGKGTVQAILDLDQALPFPNMEHFKPMGGMRITIQKFYRVSGESTQYRGVIPDIVLPDRLGHLETGEKYLDYSLPWDTVAATDFVPWRGAQPDLKLLGSKSSSRVKGNEQFAEISERVEKAAKRREETMQPLSQAALWQRKLEAREEAGDQLSPHGEEESEEKTKKLSEEQKLAEWIEGLKEDPYNTEAMAILGDLAPVEQAATVQVDPGK